MSRPLRNWTPVKTFPCTAPEHAWRSSGIERGKRTIRCLNCKRYATAIDDVPASRVGTTAAVLQMLSEAPSTASELCVLLGLPIRAVQAALSSIHLSGRVRITGSVNGSPLYEWTGGIAA